MKDLKISKLNDYYGALLTSRQAEIIEQYYNLDYSLKEISDNLSITRQAVHFALKQGAETLLRLEEKLGFMKRNEKTLDMLEGLKKELSHGKINEIIDTLRS